MLILGLVSLIFAAFMLYRRHDINTRVFAYSSIEHGHHRLRFAASAVRSPISPACCT